MKQYLFLLFILCNLGSLVQGQAQEAHLVRGRFFHQGHLVTQKISGRLGTSSFSTDSNHEFVAAVAGETYAAKLILKDGWQVVYPNDGILPVPEDPNFIWDIHISKGDDQQVEQQLFARFAALQESGQIQSAELLATLKSEFADQEAVFSRLNQDMIDQTRQQMDIYRKIRQENERKQELLKEEAERRIREGKRHTLNELTAHTDHFISRALDVKDVFAAKGDKVFFNNSVVRDISGKIDAYSEAYEALNRARKQFINDVQEYWQSDSRTRDARELLDFALEDLHKQTMLTTNQLVNDINEYNLGKVKKKKRRKREIIYAIRDFVTSLGYKIDSLKEKKERIYQVLNDH